MADVHASTNERDTMPGRQRGVAHRNAVATVTDVCAVFPDFAGLAAEPSRAAARRTSPVPPPPTRARARDDARPMLRRACSGQFCDMLISPPGTAVPKALRPLWILAPPVPRTQWAEQVVRSRPTRCGRTCGFAPGLFGSRRVRKHPTSDRDPSGHDPFGSHPCLRLAGHGLEEVLALEHLEDGVGSAVIVAVRGTSRSSPISPK